MRSAFAVSMFAGLAATTSADQPFTPGYIAPVFAEMSNPSRLAAGDAGDIWVGHEDNGTATMIYRVDADGVVLFGDAPMQDPDALVQDRDGTVSGIPGAVLVGGICEFVPLVEGCVWCVQPDGSTSVLFGPSVDIGNISHMRIDGAGRLLFTESASTRVMVSDNGAFPTQLFANPSVIVGVAIDDADRIYTAGADGVIRIYNPDGTLADGAFAINEPPLFLRWSPGGQWDGMMYAIDRDQECILRLDASGTATPIAFGLGPGLTDLEFGDDGALYFAASTPEHHVRRMVPCDVNVNGDDALNSQDFLDFLNAWVAREPLGDFNADNAFNTIDVLDFLNAWTAGC